MDPDQTAPTEEQSDLSLHCLFYEKSDLSPHCLPKLVIDVRIYMQQVTSADDIFRDAGLWLNEIVGVLASEINSCS